MTVDFPADIERQTASQLRQILAALLEMPSLLSPESVAIGRVRCQRVPEGLVVDWQSPAPLGSLLAPVRAQLQTWAEQQLQCDIVGLNYWLAVPRSNPGSDVEVLEGVSHLIAIASGKGGVGKSTVAANLAVALAQEGARVGLLDADIYGPSQALMMGVPDRRPEVTDAQLFLPVQVHGVHCISMAMVAGERTPMIWRGPMASGALRQLLEKTVWGELDYLLVDMPPGTGDIQLTLSQRAPLGGALVVTTPQELALQDARRAIEMFAKVQVPVLGVIENMSGHICSHCGETSPVFGAGGGISLAQQYNAALIGSIPLQADICAQSERGLPAVVADPEAPSAAAFRRSAQMLGVLVAQRWQDGPEAVEIQYSADNTG